MITVPSLYDICAGIVIKDVFGDNLAVSNQLLPKTIIQDLIHNQHYFKALRWDMKYVKTLDEREPQLLDFEEIFSLFKTLRTFEPKELLDFDYSCRIYSESLEPLEDIMLEVTSYEYIEIAENNKLEQKVHKICPACANQVAKYKINNNNNSNANTKMLEKINLEYYNLRYIISEHCSNYLLMCNLCFMHNRCAIKMLTNKFEIRPLSIEPCRYKNIRKMYIF